MQNIKRSNRGFTLIELMVVVAIISLLVKIALPAYQDSVRKSRRSDAKSALLQLSQFMERNNTVSNDYTKDATGGAVGPTGTTGLPFTTSPQTGTIYYNLSLDAANPTTANTYSLKAVPNGTQTSDTACGTLSITNTGVKGATGTLGATGCW